MGYSQGETVSLGMVNLPHFGSMVVFRWAKPGAHHRVAGRAGGDLGNSFVEGLSAEKNIGDCDSLSVCKTDEAIIAMGPTRNVGAPMPHSPTIPPPTAVPCQVVIEPTESTTTSIPEARGCMREGWSKAVGLGSFIALMDIKLVHIVSPSVGEMIPISCLNHQYIRTSLVFAGSSPRIWTTISFSMRHIQVPWSHVFKSWWEARQSHNA